MSVLEQLGVNAEPSTAFGEKPDESGSPHVFSNKLGDNHRRYLNGVERSVVSQKDRYLWRNAVIGTARRPFLQHFFTVGQQYVRRRKGRIQSIRFVEQQHFGPEGSDEGRETHFIDFTVKRAFHMVDITTDDKWPVGCKRQPVSYLSCGLPVDPKS